MKPEVTTSDHQLVYCKVKAVEHLRRTCRLSSLNFGGDGEQDKISSKERHITNQKPADRKKGAFRESVPLNMSDTCSGLERSGQHLEYVSGQRRTSKRTLPQTHTSRPLLRKCLPMDGEGEDRGLQCTS